jgi:hypothetical protein
MIYLVKDNDKVRVFYSENDMKAAGFKKAGLTVSEEQFNSNGCYARLIDGDIVVGKTAAEIAEEEGRERVAEYMAELAELDREAGAGRFIRDTSIAFAEMNGLANGKGYETLVDIEARAATIRARLASLSNTVAAE